MIDSQPHNLSPQTTTRHPTYRTQGSRNRHCPHTIPPTTLDGPTITDRLWLHQIERRTQHQHHITISYCSTNSSRDGKFNPHFAHPGKRSGLRRPTSRWQAGQHDDVWLWVLHTPLCWEPLPDTGYINRRIAKTSVVIKQNIYTKETKSLGGLLLPLQGRRRVSLYWASTHTGKCALNMIISNF